MPNENNLSEFKRRELNGELKEEPILKENPSRFVLFPIRNDDVWAMCKFEYFQIKRGCVDGARGCIARLCFQTFTIFESYLGILVGC